MNKKKYESPKVEVIKVEIAHVLAASSPAVSNEEGEIGNRSPKKDFWRD